MSSFDQRTNRLERLDTGAYTAAEYAKWQTEMRWINRLLGDTRALRLALRSELQNCSDSRVSILDVGAGSGELLTAARGFVGEKTVFLVGADLNREAARSINGRAMSAVQSDALNMPFADGSFDFVISSLFLHHLTDEDAVRLICEMSRVARKAFFIIDLHRHAAAYYLYRTFGPLLFQRFTVEDGSLSVLRSFRPDELVQLTQTAGIADAVVKRRAAFRLVLSGKQPTIS